MNKNNILGVESKVYNNCGHCKEIPREKLCIPWEIYSQWLFISQTVGKEEWGAVFNVKDNLITEWKLPLQHKNSCEVEFKEELGMKGMIHSHHGLGLEEFSGQDDMQARNLYEWSLLITFTGIKGCRKTKLPCGGFSYVDLDVMILDCPTIEFDKIKDKPAITIPDSSWVSDYHYGYNPKGNDIHCPYCRAIKLDKDEPCFNCGEGYARCPRCGGIIIDKDTPCIYCANDVYYGD